MTEQELQEIRTSGVLLALSATITDRMRRLQIIAARHEKLTVLSALDDDLNQMEVIINDLRQLLREYNQAHPGMANKE